MNRLVTCLVAVLAVSARGSGVRADGSATYDLGRKDVWKAGDVVTETIAESEDQGYTFSVPGGAAPKKETRASKTGVVLVRKCLEADPESNLSKSLVHVKTWTFDDGHGVDTSLEGAFVEAKGRGKERTWRLLASPSKPSDAAKAWLEAAFGAGRPDVDSVRRMWLPKAAVAIGDEWSADLAPFLDARFADAPIDRAAATSKVRLSGVRGDGLEAILECEAKIPFTGVPTKKGSPLLPWKKGGVLILTGKVHLKLDALLGGSVARNYALEGDAERDGKAFGVSIRSERRQETGIGGVMPDLPK